MAAKKKTQPAAGAGGRSAVDRSGGSAGSYDDWSMAELRQRAKELGLTGYSNKKKSALVAMLRDH
jgi:Rho termination factor, N-terminal domain